MHKRSWFIQFTNEALMLFAILLAILTTVGKLVEFDYRIGADSISFYRHKALTVAETSAVCQGRTR